MKTNIFKTFTGGNTGKQKKKTHNAESSIGLLLRRQQPELSVDKRVLKDHFDLKQTVSLTLNPELKKF